MGRTSDARERLMRAAIELIHRQGFGSTSVDEICTAADVRKGSFYHFFRTKCQLAVAALDADWAARLPTLEKIFFPGAPPVQRLYQFFEWCQSEQIQIHSKSGMIMGCPAFCLAGEICADHPTIRDKALEIISCYQNLFASAIADAMRQDLLPPGNPDTLSRILFNWFEGTLMLARIQNDPTQLSSLPQSALQLVGLQQSEK